MEEALDLGIDVYFKELSDPRIERTKKYPLDEIIFLTIAAVLCGANSWQQIVLVGTSKLEWLRRFYPFACGVPSHDTIGRVFSLLDPSKFHDCFLRWTQATASSLEGEIVAIDGKAIRGSSDHHTGREAIHLVNAWGVKNGLSLGQIKVSDKSNEITAIPSLLELLAIKGAIATIDAMGTQKEIAKAILDKEADYVLTLKGNQGNLHKEVTAFFDSKSLKFTTDKGQNNFLETIEKGHGRIETRQFVQVEINDTLRDWCPSLKEWKGINSVVRLNSIREVGEKISQEHRYYISSLGLDVPKVAEAIRGHWGVENGLHWTLDVTFSDDASQVRKDHAPNNFGIVKKIAINALKLEKSTKGLSMVNKRLKAAMENDYLGKLMCQLK